ncbi:MAG: cobalt transporter subunit CbtA [Paracoccaceae bacterium]|jgi:cobalt transporter subunit CbtA
MFRRIFFTAIVAGLLGGIGISVVHEFTTTPIILHAEEFENSGGNDAHKQHSLRNGGISLIAPAHAHGPEKTASGGEAWGPGNGLERTFFTTLANIITGIGFALILTACFALSGRPVTGQTGVLWGLAGFGIASLAPALGLPPEIPGSMAADLASRQMWWFLCVAATAGGLWAMVFRDGAVWTIGGIIAIALPHLIGAPQPESIGGNVPPELAAHFVAASLATAAIFWCATGWLAGTFWNRLSSADA